MYENLLKGSRNHLRAFVRTLERQGISYEPVYLEQEVYDVIIGTSTEKTKKKKKKKKKSPINARVLESSNDER